MDSKVISKNLINILENISVEKAKSKEGNEYLYLNLEFKGGYKKRAGYVNDETLYIINDMYTKYQNKTKQDFKEDMEGDVF